MPGRQEGENRPARGNLRAATRYSRPHPLAHAPMKPPVVLSTLLVASFFASSFASPPSESRTVASLQQDPSPKAGDEAPKIKGAEWVLNAPEGDFSLERYRGRVVLVQQWWFPCPACRATFDWLEERHQQFSDAGLQILTFEQLSTRDAGFVTAKDIRSLIDEKGGVSYPVSRGGTQAQWRGSAEFPYFWLIDVEGNVVYHEEAQGAHYLTTRAKLLELIPQELKKVMTPPLGLELHKRLKKCVKHYDAGKYASAWSEVEKITARTIEDEALAEDCETMTSRLEARSQQMLAEAEWLVVEGRYARAIDFLSTTASAFKGRETGKLAAARAKELKGDKAIKREISAMKKLMSLLPKLTGLKTDTRNKKLTKFIADHEGTRAARKAEQAKR